jgi:phosphoglycolate phosphatase-like HAD superfamily hydrolase
MEDHFLKTEKFKILEKEFYISSNDSIFITDTIGDIIEAREVGYKSIGITGGSHCRKTLVTEKPVCIVDSFLELKKNLE